MMRLWMAIAWLATVLPLALMWLHLRPLVMQRWRASTIITRAALPAIWLTSAFFLLSRPHQDEFAGLDNQAYRKMSEAFAAGRGFHDTDELLADVPPELRTAFLYRSQPPSKPTRDLAFQLDGWHENGTKPFFYPLLPLAAAAQHPIFPPELFVPFVGLLWLTLALCAGFVAGGGGGLLASAALFLTTPWPAWFLRGFFPEVVGACLIGAVVAAAAARPMRGASAALAGLMLGLAVSYHPILLPLAAPVALVVALGTGGAATPAAAALGMAAGVFPLWAFTRWVCQPYGDWTSLGTLRTLISTIPEFRAVALACAALLVLALAAAALVTRSAARAQIRRLLTVASPWIWLTALAAPLLIIAALPGHAGGTLRTGARATLHGFGISGVLLLALAAAALLQSKRTLPQQFMMVSIACGALLPLFVKGLEVPVGVWSQRRFAPVVLTLLPLLTPPLAAALDTLRARQSKLLILLATATIALCGVLNLVRWPQAYGTIGERGSSAFVGRMSAEIGPGRLTIFDYFPHAVPYMANLGFHVLGLGDHSTQRWPEVADWLNERASAEEVRVVTSWHPPLLEDNAMLDGAFALESDFPTVKTRDFLPLTIGHRTVTNHLLNWIPLRASSRSNIQQIKLLDGGPLALRGPWGPQRPISLPDGRTETATWTRQGSGIIGPLPAPGGKVIIEIIAASAQGRAQTIWVTPPWDGVPCILEVPPRAAAVRGILRRSAYSDNSLADNATGIYTFASPSPYDPSADNLHGYPDDLGVLMQRISIEKQ